jgi:preprotein translocase subunit SecG
VTISDALNFVQLILAIVLTTIILLQTKGSGFTGMFGGDSSTVYRTKRGFELVLFRVTIGLSVAFFLVALLNSLI